MELKELKELYKALHVTFKDDLTLKRAIIYYQFVKDTYDSLTTGAIKQDLSKIVQGYERVAPAFTQSGLLGGLCEILDEYIVNAVNAELKILSRNYGQYFQDMFRGYPNSVTGFLKKYQRTGEALQKLTRNFQDNIKTACKRILNDWSYLQRIFAGKNSIFDKLIDIQSTGSDFHKGGLQVLILTFSIHPQGSPRRIVYKPSDLEVDCLIIGDSQAVNTLYSPSFQDASLMEILNELIKDNPNCGLQPFPTYKILPRYAGSRLQPDASGKLPIRNSYGYIEYLAHEEEKAGRPLLNLYPFGRSDFKIFPGQNEKEICAGFYSLLGQLAAIAAVFSLSDLHMENLIVHSYLPYLIDLENSLTRTINMLSDTEILGWTGAVDGVFVTKGILRVSDTDSKIDTVDKKLVRQNRLWKAPNELISTLGYCSDSLAGLEHTINLIHKVLQDKRQPFEGWFTRLLAGAIVRVVSLETEKFHSTVKTVYGQTNSPDSIEQSFQKEMGTYIATKYQSWVKDPTKIVPHFLCLQSEYVSADLKNLDIPVFYHQLDTANVLDSQGIKIQVPDTIDITNIPRPVKSLLNRQTYFPAPPINQVKITQLMALKDVATLLKRKTIFVDELQRFMQSDVGRKIFIG